VPLLLIVVPEVGCPSTEGGGVQVGETEPFISELLGELTTTIQDLETHQIHMFYEAVGLMISADADNRRRDQYLVRFGFPLLALEHLVLTLRSPIDMCGHRWRLVESLRLYALHKGQLYS
jgi:hypothetical protein